MSHVGDLGRRVCERRKVLGLTIDEVAARANMDPTFLRKLEESPSLDLSAAALWRLAGALETTADAIKGGGLKSLLVRRIRLCSRTWMSWTATVASP
jgi:transcriptional regulator with XRE-family HTH domain